jgi:hypothetical protein
MFSAILLPAGSHEIELRYQTPGLRLGAAVSLGTLAVLILFLIIYTIVSLILHGRDRRLEAIPVGTFEQAEITDGKIDAAIDTAKEKNAAAGEADLSAEKEENSAADAAEAAGVITAAAEENSVD